MANDEEWVEDVKRWFRTGTLAAGATAEVVAEEEVALGYEAAHPALQSRHWPEAPTRDR